MCQPKMSLVRVDRVFISSGEPPSFTSTAATFLTWIDPNIESLLLLLLGSMQEEKETLLLEKLPTATTGQLNMVGNKSMQRKKKRGKMLQPEKEKGKNIPRKDAASKQTKTKILK